MDPSEREKREEREREERERASKARKKPGHLRRGDADRRNTGTCRECDGRLMIRDSRREIDTCQQRHTDTAKPDNREKWSKSYRIFLIGSRCLSVCLSACLSSIFVLYYLEDRSRLEGGRASGLYLFTPSKRNVVRQLDFFLTLTPNPCNP
jgi:hypothetical protein